MFACLCQPSFQQTLFGLAPDDGARAGPAAGRLEACPAGVPSPLETLAHEFSPRVEVHRPHLVSLDIAGLGRLLGTPADIADELQRAAQDRGLRLQIAVAPTRTAAMLLALSASGLGAGRSRTPPGAGSRKPPFDRPRATRSTVEGSEAVVIPPGGERNAVAPLPLGVLRQLPFDSLRSLRAGRFEAGETAGADEVVALLRRWGLKTLGDLAGLPSRPLSERLGQHGVLWQRLARGEDLQPLIAGASGAPIEETLDLEWPVEGLEPLSFVLARMCEPLAERLAAQDLAAVVLHLSFRLTSRDTETRELQLPAPMRDPKVLRTLILLHLESHPLPGGVDRLTLRVDAAPARITQFSLLARARPFPEQMATLLARLSALLGERRVGAPALVDSHRPGAFGMARFSGGLDKEAGPAAVDEPLSGVPRVALRRFRTPVPARVLVKDGRPARVSMERRGLEGGMVTAAAGPWRTSGDWWRVHDPERSRGGDGWNRDEWDVALSDGALYRVYRDRTADRWFVDGIVD
jgi:protein ImuB